MSIEQKRAVFLDNEPIENVVKDCAARSTTHVAFFDRVTCDTCTMGEMVLASGAEEHQVAQFDFMRKLFSKELIDNSLGYDIDKTVEYAKRPQKNPIFITKLVDFLKSEGIDTFLDFRNRVMVAKEDYEFYGSLP